MFSGGVLDYVLKMTSSVLDASAFGALRTALFSYAAIAVVGVIILFTSLLCFISVKNMQKINVALSGVGIVTCIVSWILISSFVKKAQTSLLLSGKNGWGLIVVIAMFAVVLAVNLLLSIKGIPVEYDEGMTERAAIYKKVKAGEIDIDTLPQPVVETAETRKIDEEIAKEEANYKKKHETEAPEDGDR